MQYVRASFARIVIISLLCIQGTQHCALAQAGKTRISRPAVKEPAGNKPASFRPAGKPAAVKTTDPFQSDEPAVSSAPHAKKPWDLEMDVGQEIWNTVGKRATANGGWDEAEHARAMSEAEQHYRRALELAKQGSLIDQSKTWYMMARVFFFQKKYSESVEYYTHALNLRKQADPADTVEVGDIYEQLAMCRGMESDNHASYDYSLKAYRIYSKFLPPDDNKFRYVARTLGQFCATPSEAIAYKRQEAEITKKQYAQYPGMVAPMVFMVAIEQGNAGLLDEALATAAEAMSYADKDPGNRYKEFIEWNVRHWQRQKAGLEAPWDVIYEPRYAGRNPRIKKVANPNPPTVAMLDGSSPPRDAGDGEKPNFLPRKSFPKPKIPPSATPQTTPETPAPRTSPMIPEVVPKQESSPPQITASQPPAQPSVPRTKRASDSGRRYYFQGREVSADEYEAVKLSNDACDYIRQHKFQQASEQLKQALELMPDLPFAHANLGIAMNKLGLRKGAVEHLQRAVELEPNNAAPLGMLASTYQANGQLDEAVATYRAYAQKFPTENDVPVVKSLAADLEKEAQKQRKALSMSGQSADSYLPFVTVSGKLRWANDHIPVKVFVSSERNVHGYRPEFSEIMRQCFDDWTKAGGPAIKLVASKKDADIDCYFTDNFGAVSSPAEGGEAQMRYSGEHFTHTTIVIMTVHATDTLDLTASEMRAVCLHEIGHSMGLHGHSPNPDDIMFCSIPDTEMKKPDLTARDSNTMKLIYRQ